MVEQINFLCMPLKKNMKQGQPGWVEVSCPKCGQICWKRPIDPERRKRYQDEVCTDCAFKLAAQLGKH